MLLAIAPQQSLDGIRVVDLTSVIMGPLATQILGDLGADIIKIESPDGDITRRYAPARNPGMSALFLNLNRNKRSVVLDLKREEDRQALLTIIAKADVFVHNVRAAAMARIGLSYDDVRQINPRIVYCVANGFGSGGPYSHKAAYDDLMQAACGLSDLQLKIYGEPQYVPTALCDKVAGLTIAYALLAALFHRERTGLGQSVEVPMFETNVAFNLIEHAGGALFQPPLGPAGFARYMTRMRRPYATADGYAAILPYTDRNWCDFFAFIARPALKDDDRFSTVSSRAKNADALYALVDAAARTHTTAEWIAFCDLVSIPAIPIFSLDQLWTDPHLQKTGFFGSVEHPSEGTCRSIPTPVRFSRTPVRLSRPAPRHGEHTDEVLRDAGVP